MCTNDDKTPFDRPQPKKEISGLLEKIRSECHGEFDNVHHTMSGYYSEEGTGSKDTNMTLVRLVVSTFAVVLHGSTAVEQVEP